MQYLRTTIVLETDASTFQTRHHPGPTTNKPTLRNSSKTTFSTPLCHITEQLPPTELNGFSLLKRTHPPSNLPKSKGSIRRKRGINTKIYSKMKRISTNTPSPTSPLHLPSGRRLTSRSTSARSASHPPLSAKTRTGIKQNRKPWCSC